jgi:leucyl-tRNA synthetase
MELTNMVKAEGGWGVEEKRVLVKLLAPLAPFIAEEMWEYLNQMKSNKTEMDSNELEWESVHYQSYPEVDESKVVEKPVVVVVQVNGRLRGSLTINSDMLQATSLKEEIIKKASEEKSVAKHLLGTEVVKTIWVEPRAGKQGLVNFVVK